MIGDVLKTCLECITVAIECLDGKNNADFDALLICTDHDAIDFVKITEGQKLIIDTRNAISRSEVTFNENQVVRA